MSIDRLLETETRIWSKSTTLCVVTEIIVIVDIKLGKDYEKSFVFIRMKDQLNLLEYRPHRVLCYF